MLAGDEIVLERAGPDFPRLAELLALIRRAFASMDGVIDPPSSVHRLDEASLRKKCAGEIALVAFIGERLAGCAFLAERDDHFYLGKLAVDPELHGRGVARRLVAEAERIAIGAGKPTLELQTRVELTANQATFTRLGFAETGRTAHESFARPTSITMRKALA